MITHVNEALFLVEIEDVETGEIIEEPGRRGKMIITALDRQAQPCVRFDSKDVIEWADEPCPCGRTARLIKGGVVGRADDITKVKGVLLAPSAIEEVVRDLDGLGDEYEVVVQKDGDTDRIKLRVEVLPEASSGSRPICDMILRFAAVRRCQGMRSRPNALKTYARKVKISFFARWLCCDPFQNAHVLTCTLRF
jgi:phenylacetate-CoA ligase